MSRDLLHWEHLPVAIPYGGGVMAFSGSAVVDASSVEVFGNGGHPVITDLIFPQPGSVGLEVYSQGGTVRLETLDIWRLEPRQ